jgi:hypothetical protein
MAKIRLLFFEKLPDKAWNGADLWRVEYNDDGRQYAAYGGNPDPEDPHAFLIWYDRTPWSLTPMNPVAKEPEPVPELPMGNTTSSVVNGDFHQVPSLNILLTTIGRPELRRMLDSLISQLEKNDYLTIVSDSGHTEVDNILKLFNFKCTVSHIINPTPLGHWGHGSRNKYQNNLSGDYILNADDDDRYVEGALDKIRQYITGRPRKLYIFRHKSGEGYAWTEAGKVVTGNVGTSCGVIPNSKNLPPEWGYFYGGDGNFYEKLSRLMEYEFVDEVIYKVGNTL